MVFHFWGVILERLEIVGANKRWFEDSCIEKLDHQVGISHLVLVEGYLFGKTDYQYNDSNGWVSVIAD